MSSPRTIKKSESKMTKDIEEIELARPDQKMDPMSSSIFGKKKYTMWGTT